MKRRCFAIILSTFLVFSQVIPVFAENLDNAETEMVIEQVSSDVNESAGILVETDEAAFADSDDDYIDETNQTSEESEIIFQSDETEYESSVDTEGELSEEISLTNYVEGENEELIFDNSNSVMQEDKTMLVSEGIETTSIQTYAAGNSISSATSISIGSTYSGSISSSNTADFYKFTLSSSGSITLTSTALIPWVDYRIYDSTGARLWSSWYAANSSGQSNINEEFDLTKGTYYLGVEQYSSSYTGSYSFKLVFTSAGESYTETGDGNNNTIATASSIATGTTYKGQIAKNDDKDFYKFTISSSGKYTLSSTATIPWVYYRIYNSTGDRLWSNWYAANSAGKISVNETIELSSGVYYLGVEQYSSSYTGNYSFKVDPHSHSYTSKVTKATTSQNGKINYECGCGATKESIIYYPKSISLSVTMYKYDGKAKKPSVTVKGSDGKTISSSNYTVSYASGRKNVGIYKVSIKFKGNYSGTVTKTFKINPKATSLSKLTAKSKGFTVKWKKQTTQVSGYQIQYSTSKNFSSKTTKTITKNSTTSTTYKGLKAKKKYYVRIRTYKTVSGTKYYSSWSSTKTVTTKK